MNYSELGDSFEPSNEFVLQTHIHLSPTDAIRLRKFLGIPTMEIVNDTTKTQEEITSDSFQIF